MYGCCHLYSEVQDMLPLKRHRKKYLKIIIRDQTRCFIVLRTLHCRDWRKLVACQICVKFSKFPFSHCFDLSPLLLEKQICHWVLAKFQQNWYVWYIKWKCWSSWYLFLPQELCGSCGVVFIILGLFNLFFNYYFWLFSFLTCSSQNALVFALC